MKTKKTVKKALLSSVVALVVCFTMLLGTTFAWFTDSAESKGNIIQTGTLNVAMHWADGDEDPASATWNNAESGAIFGHTNWEPGYTEARHIRIANAGSLALKYQLRIVANGEVSKLAEVIDVYYFKEATQLAREDAMTGEKLGTLKDVIANRVLVNGELAAEGNSTITLVFKMSEDVTNEYQGLSLGCDFSVQVVATQLAAEEDSFGPEYDEGAWVEGMPIKTGSQLATALTASVNTPDAVITLSQNLVLDETWTPIGDKDAGEYFMGTLDGNGYTISGLSVTEGDYVSLISAAKDATIKNLTVEGTVSGDNAAGIVARIEGETVVENCVSNVDINGTTKAGGIVSNVTGANAKIINCTNNGDITWSNAAVGGVGGLVGYVNNNAYLEIINCTNNGDVVSEGNTYAGAAVGYAAGTSKGLVAGMVNTGEVKGALLNDGRYLKDGETVLCGYVGTIGNWIAAKSVRSASELQAALDAATGESTIYVSGDIIGDVTATQKPDVKITIEGNGHKFSGVLLVDGKSARYDSAALTIKNFNFEADSLSADAYIRLGNGTNATRYTNHVTVENCTFKFSGSKDVAAVKSYTGGDLNLTISGCTAYAGMHSLLQVKNVEEGLTITDCFVYSKNGINLNNTLSLEMSGCTFDVKGYAVRVGEGSAANTTEKTFNIKDSTLKSACADGDAVIIFRGSSLFSTLNLVNTTLDGSVEFKGNTDKTTILMDGNVCVTTGTDLQDIIGNATDDVIISLGADINEIATLPQSADVDVVIDGRGHTVTSTIYLQGKSRFEGEETLTFKNLNFVTDSNSAFDFISANSTASAERYAHNVTVENCTFTATGTGDVVGLRLRQTYDITIKNCTFTGMHSILWATGVSGITVDNVTSTNCKNGMSFGTSKDIVVKNCNVEATGEYGYGVRVDASVANTMLVENCEMTATAPILLRNATAAFEATLRGNTLNATGSYQVIVTAADFTGATLTAPTGNVVLNGAEGLVVFKG